MAHYMENVFMLLLAFLGGSFLTWMMAMHTVQKYESVLREIESGAHNLDRDSLQSVPMDFMERKLHNRHREDPVHTTQRPAEKQHISPKDPRSTSEINNANKTRVLCWVMTSPTTLHSRAIGVKKTWGPRCDVTLYMSSKADPDFPAVGLPVKEGRQHLWDKAKEAFLYIFKHHFNDADWFMKADDDTYVMVENLRDFLRDKNSSKPVYYGHHFKKFVHQGYMSGGAGYVMSKEALRSMVVKQLQMPNKTQSCEFYNMFDSEDIRAGLCLQMAGVVAGDSRDAQNKSRFLPLNIEHFFYMQLPEWYHRYSKHKSKPGPECCSDSLISIHYVTSQRSMLLLDYYIHGIKVKTQSNRKFLVDNRPMTSFE